MAELKPCSGEFTEDVQLLLGENTGRAQWHNHACGLCGQSIGARQLKGKWVPDQHWHSVIYLPRNGGRFQVQTQRRTVEASKQRESSLSS